MRRVQIRAVAAGLGLLFAAAPAAGNETDQFTIPRFVRFADTGSYFSHVHYRTLEGVAERLNEWIDDALAIENEAERCRRLARLHSPRLVADLVRNEFGQGFLETMELEQTLRRAEGEGLFGTAVAVFTNPDWIYASAHLPVDPRNLTLVSRSGTVQMYGVLLGTDKVGHFHDLGHIYFIKYLSAMERGQSEDDAIGGVVRAFSRGFISEAQAIGAFSTGVASNADLAANFAGYKFYRNLTEPVTMVEQPLPPLLVRVGPWWRLNTHVRPGSDFMAPFVTDHLNEALNPSIYESGMRAEITQKMRASADDILYRYRDSNGRAPTREWFEQRARELRRFGREDYGHLGLDRASVTIASVCFPPETESSSLTIRTNR